MKADAALPLRMNGGVRFANRLPQSSRRIKIAQLEVGMWNVVHGELTCQFARRVGTHPVGDNHQMSTRGPRGYVVGHHNRNGILIIRAAHAQITERSMLQHECWAK